MQRLMFFAPLLAVPLTLLACDATVAGKNEVLRFRYDADDTFLPSAFSTPLGAGLSAQVEVFFAAQGAGGSDQTPASVVDAVSNDEAVVTVAGTGGNRLTLQAKTAGIAEVSVHTSAGDDAFDVRVVDVARVDLSHPGVLVSDNPPSKGLVGGTARFIVALKDSKNEAAVGFGTLEATVAPSGAAVVLASEAIGFVPVRFVAAGPATLTGLGDEPLELDLVADGDVLALELKGPDVVTSLKVGLELAAVLRGITADGEKVVGVASLASVASADANICTILPVPKLGEGAYSIRAKAAGNCHLEATLGARAVSHDLTILAP